MRYYLIMTLILISNVMIGQELVAFDGSTSIGIKPSNLSNFFSTLSSFGNSEPNSFTLSIFQGGEGIQKGIYWETPDASSSTRLFMEDNYFFIGRGSANNGKVITLDNSSNVGISQSNPRAKLHVSNGDIYVDDLGKGVIMKSPDGSCWRLTVDNSGAISSTSVSCP